MVEVVESSLEAGSDMLVVNLWVTCTLLVLAQHQDASSRHSRPHVSR